MYMYQKQQIDTVQFLITYSDKLSTMIYRVFNSECNDIQLFCWDSFPEPIFWTNRDGIGEGWEGHKAMVYFVKY